MAASVEMDLGMATEREMDIFPLPLPTRQDATLLSTWGLGDQLFVFPSSKVPCRNQGRPSGRAQATNILDVRRNADMYGPITRKLVNESHSVFVMLQGQVTSHTGSALYSELKKASRNYRSVLKACTLELGRAHSQEEDEGKREHYYEQVQLLEIIHLIWSLCEILFIDISPGDMVLTQLLQWIYTQFPQGRKLAQDIINESVTDEGQADAHPQYWEAVYRLLLQGDVDRVRKLLTLHSSGQTQPFVSVDELLRKMPQWGTTHAMSMTEFDLRWRHWREECMRRYEEGQFTAFSNLEVVVQILCGDALVFSEQRELCETWYHLLVSRLLYQNPTIRPADLSLHVQECMEEFQRAGDRMGNLDNILQAALEFDIHQVIKDSSAFLSGHNWWFVAHLTDILHHCKQMDSQKLAFGSNMREFLLLEYAAGLMSHHSLWQVGVDYLDFCPVFGRDHLKLYIESLPLDSERKANKLLHICQERDLHEQAQSICKVMGMKCTDDGRLGSALSWFLRSKDVPAATRLTERFLQEYKQHGRFSHVDLLDHLGPSMLLTKQLTFLGKYREFHKLYQEKDLQAAAALLLALLAERVAPQDFWVTLLMDALPLLETPQVVLGTQQTYELMHCLEELTQELQKHSKTTHASSVGSQPVSPGVHISTTQSKELISQSDQEKLKFLRLALARNLSRAILHEGTIVPA